MDGPIVYNFIIILKTISYLCKNKRCKITLFFSGTVKVILRWNFPGHDGDAIASGYRIFINGNQYGRDLSVHTTNALVEVRYINAFR